MVDRRELPDRPTQLDAVGVDRQLVGPVQLLAGTIEAAQLDEGGGQLRAQARLGVAVADPVRAPDPDFRGVDPVDVVPAVVVKEPKRLHHLPTPLVPFAVVDSLEHREDVRTFCLEPFERTPLVRECGKMRCLDRGGWGEAQALLGQCPIGAAKCRAVPPGQLPEQLFSLLVRLLLLCALACVQADEVVEPVAASVDRPQQIGAGQRHHLFCRLGWGGAGQQGGMDGGKVDPRMKTETAVCELLVRGQIGVGEAEDRSASIFTDTGEILQAVLLVGDGGSDLGHREAGAAEHQPGGADTQRQRESTAVGEEPRGVRLVAGELPAALAREGDQHVLRLCGGQRVDRDVLRTLVVQLLKLPVAGHHDQASLARGLQLGDLRSLADVVEQDQELAVHRQGPEPFRPFIQGGRHYRAGRREPADEIGEDIAQIDRGAASSLGEVGHQVATVEALADQVCPLLPQRALPRSRQPPEHGDERSFTPLHPPHELIELGQLLLAVDELLRLPELRPWDHTIRSDRVPGPDVPLQEEEAEGRDRRDHGCPEERDRNGNWKMDCLGKASDSGRDGRHPGRDVPVCNQLVLIEIAERHSAGRLLRTHAGLMTCPTVPDPTRHPEWLVNEPRQIRTFRDFS